MKSDKQPSQFDSDQVIRYAFDDDQKANRVIIVGADGQDIANSIKDAVESGLKNIKIDLPQGSNTNKQMQVTERIIEKIVEVPKIEYVERIVLVEKPMEVKIIEVPQKPLIVHNTEIVEVEKLVYIDKFNDREVIKYVQKSTFEKVISVIQIIFMAAIVAMQLSKR